VEGSTRERNNAKGDVNRAEKTMTAEKRRKTGHSHPITRIGISGRPIRKPVKIVLVRTYG